MDTHIAGVQYQIDFRPSIFKIQNMTKEEIAEIYCELMDEEFYNLMNMYRISPITNQKYTQDRYDDVIKFLLKTLWKHEKEK